MKRILFITPFTPCNKDAGSNYTKQLLEKLSLSNQIDLCYFKYKNDPLYNPSNKNIQIIKKFSNNKLLKITNIIFSPFLFPLFTVRFNWIILIQLYYLTRKRNYDIIYCDFSQTFLYAKFLRHNNIILMSHDVIYQRFSRKKINFKTWIKYSENWVLHGKNKHTFTFSPKDNQLLSTLYDIKSKDVCFFIPQSIYNTTPSTLTNNIIFFGMWKRADNYQSLEWFIDNILPHITCNTTIIGGGLPNHLNDKIKKLKNIQYIGFIENPYPIIANAKALLSPLFSGAGVKVKVIEALACGTPVIGSKIAFEGIDNIYHNFMIEVNTIPEYITAIENIHFSLEERVEFKKFFQQNYSKKSILDYINCLS